MASPDIKGDEEQAKGEFGDANGLVNHEAKSNEKETVGAKGEIIPVNTGDEKVPDDETIDKHLILSPSRRISTNLVRVSSVLTHIRTGNEDGGMQQGGVIQSADEMTGYNIGFSSRFIRDRFLVPTRRPIKPTFEYHRPSKSHTHRSKNNRCNAPKHGSESLDLRMASVFVLPGPYVR